MEKVIFKDGLLRNYLNNRKQQVSEEVQTIVESGASLENEQLIKSLGDRFSLSTLTLDIDNMDIHPYLDGGSAQEQVARVSSKKLMVKYTIPFKGNKDVLFINSQNGGGMNLPITTKDLAFSFELETGYHNSLEMPEPKQRTFNAQVNTMLTWIKTETNFINEKITSFNEELPEFIKNFVNVEKEKIDEYNRAKDKFNPNK